MFKKPGLGLIANERREQKSKHGWTIAIDVEKNCSEQLSEAASILAIHEDNYGCNDVEDFIVDHLPHGWSEKDWEKC